MTENNDNLFPGNSLITSKLSCGKSIIELSTFDNLALWWFVDIEYNNYYQSITHKNNIIQRGERYKTFFILIKKNSFVYLFFKCFLKITSQLTIKLLKKTRNNFERPTILFSGQDIEWRQKYNSNGELERYDQFFNSIVKYIQKQNNHELLSVYPLNILQASIIFNFY